jgi:hypothetical protein
LKCKNVILKIANFSKTNIQHTNESLKHNNIQKNWCELEGKILEVIPVYAGSVF